MSSCRPVAVALLSFLAMTPAMHAARKPVAQRVTEIAIGNKVELRMRKQYFAKKGVLIDVKPDGIAIQTSRKGNRVETIPFGEIEHIRDLGNHRYATRVFANIGTVAAVLGTLLLIAYHN